MASFNTFKLTNKGSDLEYKAQAGKVLKITRFGLGDGDIGSTSVRDLTALKHEVMSREVIKLESKNSKVTIGFMLDNIELTEGFYWREIGIFAEDPDTHEEILFMYSSSGDTADYIPAFSTANMLEKYVDVDIYINDVENIQATIDSSMVFATLKELKNRIITSEEEPDNDCLWFKLVDSDGKALVNEKKGEEVKTLYPITKIKNIINEEGNDANVATTQDVETAKKDAINTAVDTIRHKIGNIYGVRRLISSTATTWERLEDAIGVTANATKNGGSVQNDFDNIYPWSNIISYNYDAKGQKITAYYGDPTFKFDGSNGEVMTRFPEFWYKREQKGGYEYVYIADYAEEGFVKSEPFSLGRYTMSGSSSRVYSKSGATPFINTTITNFRTYARNVGEGFGQMDWHYFLVQLLYLVEYANYNSQSKLGNGVVSCRYSADDKALVAENNTNRIIINSTGASEFIVGQQVSIGKSLGSNDVAVNRTITAKANYSSGGITGVAITVNGDKFNVALNNVLYTTGQTSGQCNNLGMKSGCINNDGKHSMIYRGLEDIFGNIWQFVDGINIKDYITYICYDSDKHAVDTFDGSFHRVGYTNLNTSGKYVSKVGYDSNNPLVDIATEGNGSDSTGTSDYYWCNSGNRIALVGGGWSDGAGCGFWCWYLDSASSAAGIGLGARLLLNQ